MPQAPERVGEIHRWRSAARTQHGPDQARGCAQVVAPQELVRASARCVEVSDQQPRLGKGGKARLVRLAQRGQLCVEPLDGGPVTFAEAHDLVIRVGPERERDAVLLQAAEALEPRTAAVASVTVVEPSESPRDRLARVRVRAERVGGAHGQGEQRGGQSDTSSVGGGPSLAQWVHLKAPIAPPQPTPLPTRRSLPRIRRVRAPRHTSAKDGVQAADTPVAPGADAAVHLVAAA
eukprot:2510510-Prymnesium_polylepis.1